MLLCTCQQPRLQLSHPRARHISIGSGRRPKPFVARSATARGETPKQQQELQKLIAASYLQSFTTLGLSRTVSSVIFVNRTPIYSTVLNYYSIL